MISTMEYNHLMPFPMFNCDDPMISYCKQCSSHPAGCIPSDQQHHVHEQLHSHNHIGTRINALSLLQELAVSITRQFANFTLLDGPEQ